MTRKLKPPTRERTIQIGLRLPESLVRRIDTYAATLREETGLLGVTRTDAATALLVRGLEGVKPRRSNRSAARKGGRR